MAQFTGTAFAWVSGGLAAAVVALLIGVCFPQLRRYRTATPGEGPPVAEAVAEAAAVEAVPPERHSGHSAD
jgi:hypothetical protein